MIIFKDYFMLKKILLIIYYLHLSQRILNLIILNVILFNSKLMENNEINKIFYIYQQNVIQGNILLNFIYYAFKKLRFKKACL